MKKIYNKIISLFIIFTLLLGSGGPAVSYVIAESNGIETEELELKAEQASEAEVESEAEAEAEAESEAVREAEAEAAQKAEAEAAQKAEAEAARKAEEEAARKAEEEAARKAEEEAARKAEADKKKQQTKETEKTEKTEKTEEKKEDESSPSKAEEVEDDREEKVEEDQEKDNLEDEEEEEESNLAEDVRATRHLTFPVPMMRKRALMSNGGSDGFVAVKKTAVRLKDSLDELLNYCRTFLVNLEITGEPPSIPVDVVLILDKSGSMNEKIPITSAPVVDSITKYFVKTGRSYSDYVEVEHYSGNTWRYPSGWSYRYVYWDPNGNDTGAGGNSSRNAVGKPFYFEETRMDAAKSASINFAGKVLNEAPAGSRVSVVEFSGPEYTNGYGNQNQAQTSVGLTNNITAITDAINDIDAVGGTNTQAGFLQGREVIENSGNPNSNKVVIMFTDGVPTASNGYIYANPTSINHGHVTRAVNAGKGIFTDGVADVFTVGLLQGMSGSDRTIALHLLEETQNKGWYEAPTATDLDQIFAEIAEEINYFGEDAVVVDKIGDNFDLIESTLPQGASYNPNTREITWDIGRMSSKKTLSYVVQAKPGFAGGQADTNEYATLTYTDPFGTTGLTKTFGKPKVNVPTLIEVSLTDASIDLGQSINLGSGEDAAGENYMSPVTGGDNDGINFTYEWRKVGDNTVISNDKNPSVSPTEDTQYELTVIDSNGCKAKATMWVRVTSLTDVTIEKKVTGNMGDMKGNFPFTVKVEGEEEPRTFELSNGKTETLYGIPRNAQLTLTETDSKGHEVTVKINNTEISVTDGKYIIDLTEYTDEAITIEVINDKDVLVDTGVSLDSSAYILILLGAVFGLAIKVIPKKNYE